MVDHDAAFRDQVIQCRELGPWVGALADRKPGANPVGTEVISAVLHALPRYDLRPRKLGRHQRVGNIRTELTQRNHLGSLCAAIRPPGPFRRDYGNESAAIINHDDVALATTDPT